jgi:anti-anti-sigma factor
VTLQHCGDTLIIVVGGDLAADTVARFAPLTTGLPSGVRQVVADLAGVDFIDVAGLRAVFGLQQVCHLHGATFTVRDPSVSVRWLTDLTGTTSLFPVTGPHEPGGEGARATGDGVPRAGDRRQALDDREEQLDDREALADERERLLDERQDRVTAHQQWEDIREDLANQREHHLEQRERRLPDNRQNPDR